MLRRGRKPGLFGDALRLLKVSSFVHNNDPVSVHQAVGDETCCRRSNYDPLEVEVRGRFDFLYQLLLLAGKIVNYRTTDVTLRRLKPFGRLHFSGLLGIERLDQYLPP